MELYIQLESQLNLAILEQVYKFNNTHYSCTTKRSSNTAAIRQVTSRILFSTPTTLMSYDSAKNPTKYLKFTNHRASKQIQQHQLHQNTSTAERSSNKHQILPFPALTIGKKTKNFNLKINKLT